MKRDVTKLSKIMYKTNNQLKFRAMKKLFLITAFIFFTGLNGLFAQERHIIPIPAYDYILNQGNALFQEMKPEGNFNKEKREMDVVVSSTSHGPEPVFATIWIVKEFGEKVLGPFTVDDNEKLTVEIDGDKWGAIVKSDFDVSISIWIE